MYEQTKRTLREAYDKKVSERESATTQEWKASIRDKFLQRLRQEEKHDLLEVGAGTGIHSKFFSDSGLDVIATDLAPAMVDACRKKGLRAFTRDFLSLDFHQSFDAVFSMNCLLHVPATSLKDVLESVRKAMRPGALFFWGQYGGVEHTGPMATDNYVPKRFFSLITDEQLQRAGADVFEPVSFETIEVDAHWEQHFQASIWRRRDKTS